MAPGNRNPSASGGGCRVFTGICILICSILDVALSYAQIQNICRGVYGHCPPPSRRASAIVHAVLYLMTACFGISSSKKRCVIVTYLVLVVLVGYISSLNTINYALDAMNLRRDYLNPASHETAMWLSVVNAVRLLFCFLAACFTCGVTCCEAERAQAGQQMVTVERRAQPQQLNSTAINMGYISQEPPSYNEVTPPAYNPAAPPDHTQQVHTK